MRLQQTSEAEENVIKGMSSLATDFTIHAEFFQTVLPSDVPLPCAHSAKTDTFPLIPHLQLIISNVGYARAVSVAAAHYFLTVSESRVNFVVLTNTHKISEI